jgi:hypothetical protein
MQTGYLFLSFCLRFAGSSLVYFMKSLLSIVAVFALVGSASSQVLTEDFSTGVPPTGWIQINNNASLCVGWISDGFGRAWHEDESIDIYDNTLVSPVFSLAGVSNATLTFQSETNYSAYLANNPLGYGDGISNMEISTDGGLTWTMVWTDVSTVDYVVTTETVDLSAYDGMAGLQLGIRCYGDWAQEWWVDDILIDGGGSALTYGITGLVGGGTATLTVSGATPMGGVLIGYSLYGAGPTMTPFGLVDMSLPITQLPTLTADGAGLAYIDYDGSSSWNWSYGLHPSCRSPVRHTDELTC